MTTRIVSWPRCLFILLVHDLRVCASAEAFLGSGRCGVKRREGRPL